MLCCGSFDPITKGHEDVILRAAALFDEVVVAVAVNPHKTAMFSREQRVGFCRKTFESVPNISVAAVEGSVAEYAKSIGAGALVKGLRSSSDYEYEVQMAEINRILVPGTETVFLPSRPEYQAISSSYVREFIRGHADAAPLVPSAILEDIRTITERM